MTSIHLRKPPNLLFFSAGLFSEHRSILTTFVTYAVLMCFFIFALLRLGQFDAIPRSQEDWNIFWSQIMIKPIDAHALAALAQMKTGIIVAITLYIVCNALLRRIPVSISRCRIDRSFAEETNRVFLVLSNIGGAEDAQALLQHVPKTTDSSLSSVRGIQRLVQNTTLVSQDSPPAIVESVRATLDEESQRNTSIQRLLLNLGILGTFVGLMFAAPSLTSIINDQASDAQIADGLKNLFAALATCFSTSIAGLMGSISVSSASNVLRRVHEEYLRTLDDTLLTVQAVATQNILNRAERTDFGSIWHALHQQNERLQAQTETLRKGMGALGDVSRSFTAISHSITTTAEKISELQGLFASPALAQTLGTAFAQTIHSGRDLLAEGTQKAATAMQSTSEKLSLVGDLLQKQHSTSRTEAEMLQKAYTQLTRDLVDRMQGENAEALKGVLERVKSSVNNLHNELQVHEKAMRNSPWYRFLGFCGRLSFSLKRPWSK